MAKNNKVAAQAASVANEAVNNNESMNLDEQIKAKNSLSSEAFDKAAEEINKQRQELAIEEARQCLGRSEFTTAMALASLRHARAKEKITKEFLEKCDEILKKTKKGEYTKIEHDKACDEALRERTKKLEEEKAARNTMIQEIKRNFRQYDIWNWQINWDY